MLGGIRSLWIGGACFGGDNGWGCAHKCPYGHCLFLIFYLFYLEMERGEYAKLYRLEDSFFWFAARAELVLRLFRSFFPKGPVRLLVAGCGTGRNAFDAASVPGVFVRGFDLSDEAVAFSKSRGLVVRKGDLLSFRVARPFDAVYCLDVLEHVEEEVALAQLHRFLVPKGLLFLSVPAHPFLFSSHDRALHHRKRYDRKELVGVLSRHGFEVCWISYWNFFLFFPLVLLRLLRRTSSRGESDVESISPVLNGFLLGVLRIENALLSFGLKFPTGLSLVVVARRKS